jgi:hypothetical protein
MLAYLLPSARPDHISQRCRHGTLLLCVLDLSLRCGQVLIGRSCHRERPVPILTAAPDRPVRTDCHAAIMASSEEIEAAATLSDLSGAPAVTRKSERVPRHRAASPSPQPPTSRAAKNKSSQGAAAKTKRTKKHDSKSTSAARRKEAAAAAEQNAVPAPRSVGVSVSFRRCLCLRRSAIQGVLWTDATW